MKLKKIIDRWPEIKELIKCDEFFLGVAYHYKSNDVVKYDYLSNTKRKLFWKFMNDCTESRSK